MIMPDGREVRITENGKLGHRELSEEELKELDPVYQHFKKLDAEKRIDETLSKMNISDEEKEQRKKIMLLLELG